MFYYHSQLQPEVSNSDLIGGKMKSITYLATSYFFAFSCNFHHSLVGAVLLHQSLIWEK